MSENRVQIKISAVDDGKLLNIIRRTEGSINAFGNKTMSIFRRTGEGINAFSQKYINGLESIGIGIGFVMAARNVMNFDAALKKIGRTAGLNSVELQGLRQDILSLIDPKAKLPISKDEWAGIAAELNNTGIKLKVIRDIMPQIGKGAVAGGVNKSVYAAAIGEFIDKYKVAISDLPILQEQLNQAMKFEDVRKNPEVFLQSLQGIAKTMQLLGAEGIKNVTPLLALQAQFISITGSSQEAQGAIDAIMNGILRIGKDKKKIKELGEHGIHFFGKEGIKNIEDMLPVFKKLGEEIEKSGRLPEDVAMELFGKPEAGKAVIMILKKYDEIIKKQGELKRSTGGLERDFKIEANSMEAKLQEFQNQIDSFKVQHISTVLKQLSKGMDVLNEHPLITKGILAGGGLVVGSAVLMKTAGVLKDVFGFGKYVLTGKKSAVQPVFVTNMTGGGIVSGGSSDVLMGGAKKATTFGKLYSIAGKASIVTTVGVMAYELGSLLEKKFIGGRIGEKIFDWTNKKEEKRSNEKIKRLLTPVFMQNPVTPPPFTGSDIKQNISIYFDKDMNPRVIQEGPFKTNIGLNRGAFN